MKILRRNDEFRKMPERSVKDAKIIDNLIGQGWNYSPKKAWKDSIKEIVSIKEIASDEKVDKVVKDKKTKRTSGK